MDLLFAPSSPHPDNSLSSLPRRLPIATGEYKPKSKPFRPFPSLRARQEKFPSLRARKEKFPSLRARCKHNEARTRKDNSHHLFRRRRRDVLYIHVPQRGPRRGCKRLPGCRPVLNPNRHPPWHRLQIFSS